MGKTLVKMEELLIEAQQSPPPRQSTHSTSGRDELSQSGTHRGPLLPETRNLAQCASRPIGVAKGSESLQPDLILMSSLAQRTRKSLAGAMLGNDRVQELKINLGIP